MSFEQPPTPEQRSRQNFKNRLIQGISIPIFVAGLFTADFLTGGHVFLQSRIAESLISHPTIDTIRMISNTAGHNPIFIISGFAVGLSSFAGLISTLVSAFNKPKINN